MSVFGSGGLLKNYCFRFVQFNISYEPSRFFYLCFSFHKFEIKSLEFIIKYIKITGLKGGKYSFNSNILGHISLNPMNQHVEPKAHFLNGKSYNLNLQKYEDVEYPGKKVVDIWYNNNYLNKCTIKNKI